VATVYGLFTDPESVVEDIRSALSILPGDAAALIARRLTRVLADTSVGTLGLVVAILLSTYGAARGARSIVAALNVMYGRRRRRSFTLRWGLALAIAFAGAGLMMLALFGIALHGQLRTFLPDEARLAYALIRILFWVVLSLGLSGALTILYRYGPAGGNESWRGLLPGSIAATAMWLAASLLFEAYVSRFSRLEATYGSLAAVVVLQLWLYLSALAILFGAKLNVEAARSAERAWDCGEVPS